MHIAFRTALSQKLCLCTLVLCLVFVSLTRAQKRLPLRLDPERRLTEFKHQAWREEHGLPANTITAILQGPEGYLWLGTQSGLVRFNGITFKTYTQANIDSLWSSNINVMVRGRNGGFWIGTEGGGVVRYQHGSFSSYRKADGLIDNAVHDLYLDRDGGLWIATDEGLSRLFRGEFTNYAVEDGLPANLVLSVEGNRRGTVWIGTDFGVWKWHDGAISPADIPSGNPETRVMDLCYTADGNLWAATLDGLYRRRRGSTMRYSTTDGLSSNLIRTVHQDREGSLWIGTVDQGINRFSAGRIAPYADGTPLGMQEVHALHQDREHSLWIGLEGGGLHQLRASKFYSMRTHEGLPGNNVSAIYKDSRGTRWIGTDGTGLTAVHPDGSIRNYTTDNGLPGDAIYSIAEDRRGRLWVAIDKVGACRLTGAGWKCLSDEDGLASNTVFTIYRDEDGVLWFGTNGGLTKLTNGSLTTYTTDDGLPSQFIISIREGPTGSLWMGTYGDGLIEMRPDGSFHHITSEDGLTGDIVLELVPGRNKSLWIATSPGGICRLKDGSLSCITTDNGLYSNNILQLVEDDLGYFWAGTFDGIFRVSKDQLRAAADGRRDSVTTEHFDINDGLPSNETNGGTEPAVWKMTDGHLWFATVGGVAIVEPDRIPTNTVPPPVLIEKVLVEDEEIAAVDSTVLDPGERKLEFHFSALSYTSSNEVEYRYKLDGYDAEWVRSSSRRVAYYTNLSPGTYTFRVKAANKDGVWSTRNAALTLTIQPYFYETIWFYVLCGLGVLLLGFGGYRLRVRHLHAREEELSRLVEARTTELREREEELQELNEDLEHEVERQLEIILAEREKVERKKIQLEERKRYEQKLIEAKEEAEQSARLKSTILMNMSHEIRTPLTSILGFAEVLEEQIEGDLLRFAQLIHRSGKRLLDTLNSVLDMSQLEADSMTVELSEVRIVEEVEETVHMMQNQAAHKGLYLQVNADDIQRPLLAHVDRSFLNRIIENLVGNALKFTEEGGITVRIETIHDDIVIEVEDTGIGIDEEFLPQLFDAFKQESTGLRRSHEGTGLGLAITKRLVELMDGSIDVETKRGVGTTFIIQFPHKRRELESDQRPTAANTC